MTGSGMDDIRSLAGGILDNIQKKETRQRSQSPSPFRSPRSVTNTANQDNDNGTATDANAGKESVTVDDSVLGSGKETGTGASAMDSSPNLPPRPARPPIPRRHSDPDTAGLGETLRRSSRNLLEEEVHNDSDSVNVKEILDDIGKPKTDIESAQDLLAVAPSFDEVRETLSITDNNPEEDSIASGYTNPASEIISVSSRRSLSSWKMKRVSSSLSISKKHGTQKTAAGDLALPKAPSIPFSGRPPTTVHIPKPNKASKARAVDVEPTDDDDILDPDEETRIESKDCDDNAEEGPQGSQEPQDLPSEVPGSVTYQGEETATPDAQPPRPNTQLLRPPRAQSESVDKRLDTGASEAKNLADGAAPSKHNGDDQSPMTTHEAPLPKPNRQPPRPRRGLSEDHSHPARPPMKQQSLPPLVQKLSAERQVRSPEPHLGLLHQTHLQEIQQLPRPPVPNVKSPLQRPTKWMVPQHGNIMRQHIEHAGPKHKPKPGIQATQHGNIMRQHIKVSEKTGQDRGCRAQMKEDLGRIMKHHLEGGQRLEEASVSQTTQRSKKSSKSGKSGAGLPPDAQATPDGSNVRPPVSTEAVEAPKAHLNPEFQRPKLLQPQKSRASTSDLRRIPSSGRVQRQSRHDHYLQMSRNAHARKERDIGLSGGKNATFGSKPSNGEIHSGRMEQGPRPKLMRSTASEADLAQRSRRLHGRASRDAPLGRHVDSRNARHKSGVPIIVEFDHADSGRSVSPYTEKDDREMELNEMTAKLGNFENPTTRYDHDGDPLKSGALPRTNSHLRRERGSFSSHDRLRPTPLHISSRQSGR